MKHVSERLARPIRVATLACVMAVDELSESVPIFHNAYARAPERGDMVLLSEIAASRFASRYPGRVLPRVGRKIADPWGHPFRLRGCDARWKHACELVSIGPDGVTGTRDDFSSRELPDDETYWTESLR
ncbi:MAG: type II secretion system protein GspG [bacterium]